MDCARSRRIRAFRLQRALIPPHVMPLPKFVADAAVFADALETERFMQALAGGIGQRHTGVGFEIALGGQNAEESSVEGGADAAAAIFGTDIRGHVHGPLISSAFTVQAGVD